MTSPLSSYEAIAREIPAYHQSGLFDAIISTGVMIYIREIRLEASTNRLGCELTSFACYTVLRQNADDHADRYGQKAPLASLSWMRLTSSDYYARSRAVVV